MIIPYEQTGAAERPDGIGDAEILGEKLIQCSTRCHVMQRCIVLRTVGFHLHGTDALLLLFKLGSLRRKSLQIQRIVNSLFIVQLYKSLRSTRMSNVANRRNESKMQL